MIRIGQGYDVHAFTEGDYIVLGGVIIPHEKSFKAHSDGDVLIHALCDALLGAAGLGDIGRHFPDTDAAYANIDSRKLLRHVMELLKELGWTLSNADMTIIAQAPKMAPHIESMQANLAADMGVSINQVNVKATTTEHLGFEGREEGIACSAVVLIQAP
ncbi:MAG: 2-C-methyl-D-erythritol 2,4-cyclodiphosphate synthase [Gammaproteobacteria bacterium]|nr:2-C-methyl-D-erythritol 2,4-cyclodiphosphate synthase [Gammaproteobacteria bacterium]